ncbi:hypothetical protein PtB15_3B210 [Puccinia triticina]|nr:hypothetical protein PtB15_3B210 [Puccinia triticina]
MALAVTPVIDWWFYDSIYTKQYMSTPALNPLGYQNLAVSWVEGFGSLSFSLDHCSAGDNAHFLYTASLEHNDDRGASGGRILVHLLRANGKRVPALCQGRPSEIMPILLTLLTRQNEDADDDKWNVSMATGTSLAPLAQTVADALVTPVILRDAACIIAFGSILDGPDPKMLHPLVSQALPTLIEITQDPSIDFKDTAAWTLGRVTDQLIGTIKPDVHLYRLLCHC